MPLLKRKTSFAERKAPNLVTAAPLGQCGRFLYNTRGQPGVGSENNNLPDEAQIVVLQWRNCNSRPSYRYNRHGHEIEI